MSDKLGLKEYEDIAHDRKIQRFREIIHELECLGGEYENRFKQTITYLEGYIHGSSHALSAKEQADWERQNNIKNG